MGNLQIVSTQNRVFSASESRPAKNRQAFYWKCVFGVDTPTFVVGAKGWTSSNAGEVNNGGVVGNSSSGNDFTIQECFIEINGVVKQLKFSNANSRIVVKGEAIALGDELDLAAEFGFTPLKGQQYALKGIISVAVAGTDKIPFNARVSTDVSGQQSSWFVDTDTVSAGLTPGPYTLSSGTFDVRPSGFCPISIGRPVVNVPIIFADGDSIFEGVGDLAAAGIHGRGPVQRATHDAAESVGSLHPCLNFARSGNDLTSVLGASNSKWQAWLPYVTPNSIGAFNYGTNDIGSGGTGVDATIRANINSFLTIVKTAIPTIKAAWMHVMCRTTSAGGQWVSSVDQTPLAAWVAGGRGDTHNAWLNTQVGTALAAVYDTSGVRDPARLDVFKTNGTNKWQTVDGTHLAPDGNDTISIPIRATNATLFSGSSDTTPNAFTFTAATGAALNEQKTSNTITVAGIDAAAPISIVGGEYRIGSGGSWVTTSGTVTNGQEVTVRRNASGINSTTVNAVLTIGGVDGTFAVTTVASADTTPNAFTFTAVTGAGTNTEYISNSATIDGINAAAPISIVNGTYSINGGTFTAVTGTITSGQIVRVKRNSSSSNSAAVTTVLTVGGVSGTFSITTAAAGDTTPDGFSFTDLVGQLLDTPVVSSPIMVAGITAPSAITVTGGQYSINTGSGFGSATASPGTVNNGDQVRAHQTTSGLYSTAVDTVVTIGGISDTFTSTTEAPPSTGTGNGEIISGTNSDIWVCSGTSDVLTCSIKLSQANKKMQFECVGANLANAVVTGYGLAGASKVFTTPGSPGQMFIIDSGDYVLSKITVSGVPAGTYKVKFTPIS